jgi:hypothetical protein
VRLVDGTKSSPLPFPRLTMLNKNSSPSRPYRSNSCRQMSKYTLCHFIQGYSKRSIHFQKFLLQVPLNIWRRAFFDWKEKSRSYFHTLQALDVSLTCDAVDVKSIIQLFPHSSQHVTGNSSHSLSDAPLQIIFIRTLRDFLSIRAQDMDLASVVFVK